MKQKEEKRDYIHEVHGHMASIMFFHVTVVSIVVFLKPQLLNNTYVSILNTALSLMFSVLYYMTKRTNTQMLYIYNTFYLIFASVLVAEFILYFENDTFIYTMSLVFGMFLFDLVFFNEDRKNKLFILYGLMCVILLPLGFHDSNYFYSVIGTAIYGLIIIGYMYKDNENLELKRTNQLDDALKYFLDIEGLIVRNTIQKKTD